MRLSKALLLVMPSGHWGAVVGRAWGVQSSTSSNLLCFKPVALLHAHQISLRMQ